MQFDLFSLKNFNALRWFDDKKHTPFCVKLKCVCTCKLNKLLNSSHSKNKKNKDRKCIIFICVHFVYCMSVHFTFMHLVISMLYKWNREFLTNLDYTFQKQSWSKEGNKIGITAVRFLDRLAMVQSRNNPIGSLHHSSCYINITTLV